MGRQIRFLMTARDEDGFVQFLRADPDIVFLDDLSPRAQPAVLESLRPREEPYSLKAWLWNRRISAPANTRFVSERIGYSIDPDTSEIVEFCRSRVSADGYMVGRLWAQMSWWSDDDPPVLMRKSPEFQKWYDQLARWIRKNAVGKGKGAYIFPDAKRVRDW